MFHQYAALIQKGAHGEPKGKISAGGIPAFMKSAFKLATPVIIVLVLIFAIVVAFAVATGKVSSLSLKVHHVATPEIEFQFRGAPAPPPAHRNHHPTKTAPKGAVPRSIVSSDRLPGHAHLQG